MGDQNLHLNLIIRDVILLQENDVVKMKEEIDEIVYSAVQETRGSISAEHGIGQLKKKALIASKSEFELKLMRDIKKLLDPNNILNAGKIF